MIVFLPAFFNEFYYILFAKIQYISGNFMIKLLKGYTDLFEL